MAYRFIHNAIYLSFSVTFIGGNLCLVEEWKRFRKLLNLIQIERWILTIFQINGHFFETPFIIIIHL